MVGDAAAPHDVCSILVCLSRSLMFVAFSFTRCDKDEAVLRSHCIVVRGYHSDEYFSVWACLCHCLLQPFVKGPAVVPSGDGAVELLGVSKDEFRHSIFYKNQYRTRGTSIRLHIHRSSFETYTDHNQCSWFIRNRSRSNNYMLRCVNRGTL